MSISKNDSHVEQALRRRIEQFKEKARFGDLLTSYIQSVQFVEDALFQVLDDTTLLTSEGLQLDNIGQIVGEPRFGRNDLQYATAIRARILLNVSEGTTTDIILLILALQDGLSVNVIELFPAGFLAIIETPIDPNVVDTTQISTIIGEGRPAGVRGLVAFGVIGSKQFDAPAGAFDIGKFGVILES